MVLIAGSWVAALMAALTLDMYFGYHCEPITDSGSDQSTFPMIIAPLGRQVQATLRQQA